MEAGCSFSLGSSRCSAASTNCKSSSKNDGRFIARTASIALQYFLSSSTRRSRLTLALRFERLRHHFSVRLLQQNFHFAFCFFQLFLALPRQRHAFFEQFHRFVQR